MKLSIRYLGRRLALALHLETPTMEESMVPWHGHQADQPKPPRRFFRRPPRELPEPPERSLSFVERDCQQQGYWWPGGER